MSDAAPPLCNCLVLHEDDAGNDALDLKRHLECHEVVTTIARPETVQARGLANAAMLLVIISKGLVTAAADETSPAHRVCLECQERFNASQIQVLAVVVDEHYASPNTWGGALRFLGDYFYSGMWDGVTAAFPGLFLKVKDAIDLTTKSFHITGRSSPDWRSYVQADSPYEADGFSLRGSCGAGGVFKAYTSEMPGTERFEVQGAHWWASTTKTNLQQLEWRIFAAGNKFLVTSDRRDTAPGWSIKALFYARGKPSNRCNQLGPQTGKRFHCFLSHNWKPPENNHENVVRLGGWLKRDGLVPWIDQDRLDMAKHDNILDQLRSGIDASAIIVIFLTTRYIAQCESADEWDNCYREYAHYRHCAAQDTVTLLPVVTEKSLLDPSSWGCLADLAHLPRCEMIAENDEAARDREYAGISRQIATMLGVHIGRFHITGRSSPDWRSYVQADSPYAEDGFSLRGSCGTGGVFEAYTQPVVGTIEADVQGAHFWAPAEKTDVEQLEWRFYSSGSKFLVTSNRKDMAPGWTFKFSFYARGLPSNDCNQTPTPNFVI